MESVRKERNRRRWERKQREATKRQELAQDREWWAGATEVGRTTHTVCSKHIGDGHRVELREHRLELDNGHAVRRWDVRLPDAPGTSEVGVWVSPETDLREEAQARYRCFQPSRKRTGPDTRTDARAMHGVTGSPIHLRRARQEDLGNFSVIDDWSGDFDTPEEFVRWKRLRGNTPSTTT